MRRLLPTAALGLALCGGAPAAAQAPEPASGTRVRVRLHPDGRRLVGRLVAADPDTLRLAPAAGVVGALTADDDDLNLVFQTPAQFGLAVGLVVGAPTTLIGALTGLVRTEGWAVVPPAPPGAAPGDRAGLTARPRVGTMRVPVRGAGPAGAVTFGVTLRPR